MTLATEQTTNGQMREPKGRLSKVAAAPTQTVELDVVQNTPAGWPADWRSVRKTADKLVILGHSPSTREDCPYDDPTYEVWSLNDAHAFVKGRRLTRHFEIHTRNVYRNADRRTAGYMDFLQTFPGPVYMLDPDPTIPTCVLYPKEYMEGKYGRLTDRMGQLVVEPVFTSGFSYMMTVALEEGFRHIEFYGADLMGEEEYIRQREGFAFLYGVARGMGVEIILPDACPILRAPLYGQNTTETSGLTEDYISNKIAKFRQEQGKAQTQAVYLNGKADAYAELRAKFGR